MRHPNPKIHLQLSLIKSLVRIFSGAFLCGDAIVAAGIALIIAEVIGILEELF
jgi:hypothetical protein